MYRSWAFATPSNYKGVTETAERLPSGLYTLGITPYGDPVADRQELRVDKMVSFSSGPLARVLSEVNSFWGSREHYRRLGVAHKRGILLHGPQGCGKTGILAAVAIESFKYDAIVFQVTNIEIFQKVIKAVRQIEVGRPITVLLEDIEQIVKKNEEILLEVMDGASSVGDGVLFLATTNKLGEIPDRVKWRPSRIDTLIEIDAPNEQQRREYLKSLSPEVEDLGDPKFTDGFTLAMLKELVIAMKIYGKPRDQAIATAKRMNGGVAKTNRPAGLSEFGK